MPDLDSFIAALTEPRAGIRAVMVSSVDGRATIADRVGGLTGPADQRLLLSLREHAAAVMVGGATVRAEGYDRLLDDAARERRTAHGLPPEPEFMVVTRSGPPLPERIAALRARHPGGAIVCEGGPTLLGVLVEQHLLEELVLVVSPLLVGDDTQHYALAHAAELGTELRLLAFTAAEGFVFLRYGLSQ